jgi:biopolymer transport protein ExbD
MKVLRLALILSAMLCFAGFEGTRAEEETPAPLEPPTFTGGADGLDPALKVSIAADGEVRLDGEPADWDALETALCSRGRGRGAIGITADKCAPWAVVRNVSFMVVEAPGTPVLLWAVRTKDGKDDWHQPVMPGGGAKLRKAMWVKLTPSPEGTELTTSDGSLGVLSPSGKSKDLRTTFAEFQEWEPERAARIIGGEGAEFGAVTSVAALLTRAGFPEILYQRESLPLEFPAARPMEGTLEERLTTEEIRKSMSLPEVSKEAASETIRIQKRVGVVEVIVTANREILVNGTPSDRDFIVRVVRDKAAAMPEAGDRKTPSGHKLSALPVYLLADRGALWCDVQEVLDACREAGAYKVYWMVSTGDDPALMPAFLAAEDTAAADRAAQPARFTLKLKRSRGQDRTFVRFSEIEMGPLPRSIENIEKELAEWRVEGVPLHAVIEAWGSVPFEDVLLAVRALMGDVDRLSFRASPRPD